MRPNPLLGTIAAMLAGCAFSGPESCGGEAWPGGEPAWKEQFLAGELRRHLGGHLGRRRSVSEEPAALRATADYIRDELGRAGLGVEALAVSLPAETPSSLTFENLEVVVPGTGGGCSDIVIGAHYDSAIGSPGANDNGSGTAALLELAKWAKSQQFRRTIRFVFFVNEEPPYFAVHADSWMGSSQYVNGLAGRGIRVRAMVSLETMAYYSRRAGSQCLLARGLSSAAGNPEVEGSGPEEGVKCLLPGGLLGRGFDTGDFLAFVTSSGNEELVERARSAFCEGRPGLKAASVVLPGIVPGVLWSDHAPFVRAGIPAMMLTDTAPMRYPRYHTARDLPELVPPEMWMAYARAVLGTQGVLRHLADDSGECRP